MKLADLPNTHPCYVPGFGETTVGEVRATSVVEEVADHLEGTIRMWEWLVVNPHETPASWRKQNSGPSPPDGAA